MTDTTTIDALAAPRPLDAALPPTALPPSAAMLARVAPVAPPPPDYAQMARMLGARHTQEAPADSRRDWGAALDMMQEAFEAVRLAEQQNQRLEGAAAEARRHYEAHLRRCEEQIAAATGRAEAAERRAAEAEGWLERFHAAIVEGFTPRQAPPQR